MLIARELRHLAAWCERHAACLNGAADQFSMLGLAANLGNLADRAAALESAAAPRLLDLPDGVIELAARRNPPCFTPNDGDTAA